MSTYVYKLEDGRELSAPKFDRAMSAGFVRKHRNDSIEEQMFALAEAALDEANLETFDSLTLQEMGAFYTAWQEDSGITAGE